MGFSIDKSYQTSNEGIPCVPSATDVTVTLKVRNPKNFTFKMPGEAGAPSDIVTFGSGVHDSTGAKAPVHGTDYTLVQNSRDTLTLTYKADFLKRYEWSNGNIGPEITLISTDGRKFGKKFSLNLKANTSPPKPSVTLAQTTTIPKYYVLCLKVPDMDETVTGGKLHKDMIHIEINGTKYELKINGGGTDFIKPADSAFIEASKVEKLPIPGADNPPTGAWVLYYQTDVKAKYGAEENYTITLIDEQGLVSEELKPTAKAEFPAFYVRGTNGGWYTDNVPGSEEGNDTSGDGSKEKPYATVTTALAQCTENGVPYIILTDGMIEEKNTLNIESGKMITIAALRKDYNPPVPAIIHDNRPNPTGFTLHYFITTAGTLTLDSVILKANITDTHGDGSSKNVYGIQQTGGTVTVKGEAAQVRNFAHAVDITGGTFTMEEGSICENSVDGGASGVEIKSNGTFILNGGSIKDNKATNHVGVSVIGNNAKFRMTGGEISGNKAKRFGGGVSVYSGTVDISGGTIKNNHAAEIPYGSPPSDIGGGIYIGGNGTVNFTGGTIKDNFLDGAKENCGAGVFVEGGGTFNMSGGTITGCKPDPDAHNPESSKGGGVYVANGCLAEFSNCAIENCTADLGGAIYAKGATVTINGCTLAGNTAKNGGGMYMEGGVCTLNGSLKDNTTTEPASSSGGSIYLKNGTLTMKTGAEISGSDASVSGGGVYIRAIDGGTASFTMEGGTISGCNVSSAYFVDGGGVCVEVLHGSTGTANFTMKGGSIIGCKAVSGGLSGSPFGGGVCVKNGATFNMIGGSITDCKAVINDNNAGNPASKGGGVYIDRDSTFNMSGNSRITGCTAEKSSDSGSGGSPSFNGGGVYVKDDTATFTMKDEAIITPSLKENTDSEKFNDVYLNSSAKITVDGTLTATGTVARITPENYSESPPIQVLTGGAVSSEHDKFKVTPNGGEQWEVDSDGKLKKKN